MPGVFTSGAIKFMEGKLTDRGQLKNVLLEKFKVNTIAEIGFSGIILSHAHVDHYGNLLDFPTSLPVFVGPDTMDWVGGGEDAAKKGEKGLMSFPSSFLKDRTFIEMDKIASKAGDKIKSRVKETKVGPFDMAWDWFGDGSIVVASAEGVSMKASVSVREFGGVADVLFLCSTIIALSWSHGAVCQDHCFP